jgi:hypothetical protein
MPPGKDSNAEKQKVVHEKRRERETKSIQLMAR